MGKKLLSRIKRIGDNSVDEQWAVGAEIFNEEDRQALLGHTFQEWGNSCNDIWSKSIPCRRNSQCIDSPVGMFLVCSRNRKVISVAGVSKGVGVWYQRRP